MLRSNRRRRAALTGLAALSAAAALAPPSAASAATHPLFSDPSGDAAAPIDIQTVDVGTDADGIVITQRLRDVDGPSPLFAYAPQYAVTFGYGPAVGRMTATATTAFDGTNETTLTTGGDGYGFNDGTNTFGTRTLDVAANTVTMRFAYADLPDGLRSGTVLGSFTARATYRQTIFRNLDTAAAPSGFSYTLGQ